MRCVLTGLLIVSLTAGCQTVHEVTVDAISASNVSEPQAYALKLVDSVAKADPETQRAVAQHVRAALGTRGWFEAVAPAQPAVEIEVKFGVGPSQLRYRYKPRDMLAIELWGKVPPKGGAVPIRVHEKYLRITARTAQTNRGGTRPEIWSANVSLEDESAELAPYLPALVTALVEHLGEHRPEEVTLKIKDGEAQRVVAGLKK